MIVMRRRLCEPHLISEASGRIFEPRIFVTMFASLDPVQDDII